jgi:AraC-like DNA-binding protein
MTIEAASSASIEIIAPPAEDRVELALHIIESRYTNPTLRLTDTTGVAFSVGVSPSRLASLLKMHTGLTFREHVHSLRVGLGARMLLSTRLSIKEIAVKVGYETTSTFDRHFRLQYNITPSEYRRSHWAMASAVGHIEAGVAQRDIDVSHLSRHAPRNS